MPLAEAVAAWRDTLGADRVITAGERLSQAQQATFATSQRSLAILEPGSRDEVAACLRIAHRHRVPVYPVSGGSNWGYGSRVPPEDGAVLLSLARLNRVVGYSEELAYVTVEPGVTFRMLAAFLRERGSLLLPPMTGTTPDASLIGNVLERGIGKGPYEDMAAHSCGYEVLLPTGQLVQTGFAGYPDAAAGPLRAHGPGPSLQGLFSQSNLGVITRMTLWLEPAPALRQRLFFALRQDGSLSAAIDGLRGVLLRGNGSMQAELVNGYRALSMSGQFPFATFDGTAALSASWVDQAVGARWFGCCTLWADSTEELDWRRRRLHELLQTWPCDVHAEEPVAGHDPQLSLDGIRSLYWRHPGPPPADPNPDRDGCGIIWLAPVLPMLGPTVAATVAAAEEAALGAGFEPSISLRMVGGRAIQALVGLVWDRGTPGADERAIRCHGTLRGLFEGRGAYPYRLSLLDMQAPPAAQDDSAELLRALKQLLDPHGVLAPGRYIRSR